MAGGNIMQAYSEGVTVQVFAKNVMGNGLFYSESSFVHSVIEKKIEWKYNDRFEVRMYFGGVAGSATLNSALIKETGAPLRSTIEEVGRFWAQYGVLIANQEIDMFKNIETMEQKAAFQADAILKVHGMRMQVGADFRTVLCKGRYMPVHQLMPPIIDEHGFLRYIPRVEWVDSAGTLNSMDACLFDPDGNSYMERIDGVIVRDNIAAFVVGSVMGSTTYKVKPGSFWAIGAVGNIAVGQAVDSTIELYPGTVLSVQAPLNVFATNYKMGTLLLRASHEFRQLPDSYDNQSPAISSSSLIGGTAISTGLNSGGVVPHDTGATAPWGICWGAEMYVVVENDNTNFKVAYIGSVLPGSVWDGGMPGQTTVRTPGATFFVGDYFITATNRLPPVAPTKADLLWEKFTLDKVSGATGKGDIRFTEGSSGNIDVTTWWWRQVDNPGVRPVAPPLAGGTGVTEPKIVGFNYVTAANAATMTAGVLMSEGAGAMEGFADLIPSYTCYGARSDETKHHRMGLNRFHRGSPHRFNHTPEQAGWLFIQGHGESMMDVLLKASISITTAVQGIEKCAIVTSEAVLQAIGQYERISGANGMGLVTVRPNEVIKPGFVFQRGVTGTVFKVGETEIPVHMKDNGIFTDMAIIMPRNQIFYNSRDNTFLQIREYMSKTYSKKKPPSFANAQIPKEVCSSLDIRKKLVVGHPYMGDMRSVSASAWDNPTVNWAGNDFVHPSVRIPITYYEMGALYIERPFYFAVVKFGNQIISPNDTLGLMWNQNDQSDYRQNIPVR